MDPLASAASTTATTNAGDTSTSSAKTTSSTDSSTATKKTFSELFAAAKKTLNAGETLVKVDGHSFARIKGGKRDDEYLNLSGNARNGQAFDLITRNGHTFHAYGTGKDRVVVEVGTAEKDAATGGTQSSS